jgi:hypothetical protein
VVSFTPRPLYPQGKRNLRDNTKVSVTEGLGYYEFIQHKIWLEEECSKSLTQRKQAKLQWMQNSSQTDGDNLNNERSETSRNFRTRKRVYLKQKKLQTEQ